MFGNMGARKLWRNYLPRLKYYNPNVEIIVNRTREINKNNRAPVTIYFTDRDPAVVETQYRQAGDVCKEILDITKATPLPLSHEDARTAAEYEELVASRIAREKAKEERRRIKREEKERERLGGVAPA
ncbi:hypothetical protein BDZ91DRAFT_710046 [Kalaharituber pfeilii]|nr:hypothetical protein BDZ91DRAFT_710046 [Kalaharituber pfeilii]